MATIRSEDDEIEALASLPESFGENATSTAHRVLYVCEMLRVLTERGRGLTAADMKRILVRANPAFGDVKEQTLYGYVDALAETNCLGLAVHKPAKGENTGTWAEGLKPSQARLLLNLVQSTRFLSAPEKGGLVSALDTFISASARDRISGQIIVDDRTRKGSGGALKACDTTIEAIDRGMKLEFSYIYYGLDGEEHVLSNRGPERKVESPACVIYSNDNYYIRTWAEYPGTPGHEMTYRADRVRDARVSEERSSLPHGDNADEPRDNMQSIRENAMQDARRSFEMMGGPRRTLFFDVLSDLANVFFERFGHGLKFVDIREDAETGHRRGVTCVRVSTSRTFYRWVFGLGELAEIIAPPPMNVHRTEWSDAIGGKDYGALADDYQATVSEYRSMIERALSTYSQPRS